MDEQDLEESVVDMLACRLVVIIFDEGVDGSA